MESVLFSKKRTIYSKPVISHLSSDQLSIFIVLPNTTNLRSIYYLEDIWVYRNWYNEHLTLQKGDHHFMAIWNNKNSVISNNRKCTPVDIIKQARHTYHYTILYFRNIGFDFQLTLKGRISTNKRERRKSKTWEKF